MKKALRSILVAAILLPLLISGISCSESSALTEKLFLEESTYILNKHQDAMDDFAFWMERVEVFYKLRDISVGYSCAKAGSYYYLQELGMIKEDWDKLIAPEGFTRYHECVSLWLASRIELVEQHVSYAEEHDLIEIRDNGLEIVDDFREYQKCSNYLSHIRH